MAGQDREGIGPECAGHRTKEHAHPAVEDGGRILLWQVPDGLRHFRQRAECRGLPPPQRPDGE